MNRHKFGSLIGIVASALLSVSVCVPAHANKPEVVPLDGSFVATDCAFPLRVASVGVVRIQNRSNVTKNVYNLTTTYTNLNTGKSFSTPNVGPDIITTSTDGSVTLTQVGLLGRVVVPGVGVVFAQAGRIVYRLPEFTVIFEAGPHDSLAALCPYFE